MRCPRLIPDIQMIDASAAPTPSCGSMPVSATSFAVTKEVADTGRSLSPAEAGGRHDGVGGAGASIVRAAGSASGDRQGVGGESPLR